MNLFSWGGLSANPSEVLSPRNRYEFDGGAVPDWCRSNSRMSIYGNGRSYSDVALPGPGSSCLRATDLCHVISFDRASGVIEVEAGVKLADIQSLALSAGWGLPVLPGTALATAGGALANDVHGKNHGVMGAFSRCVLSVKMFRTDCGVFNLSRSSSSLWSATVGGLGATGFILALTIQLKRWASDAVCFDQVRFSGVKEFLALSQSGHEYSVGWLDTFASPVRGVLFSGGIASRLVWPTRPSTRINFPIPHAKIINSNVSRAFNLAYWSSHRNASNIETSWESFFCPLDRISHWNRLYGRGGFSQFQCVIPTEHAVNAYEEIFKECRRSKQGSFLSVIKKFGDIPSEGVLSFARPGVTFAMDFPNQSGTIALIKNLSKIALSAGGALYPAKMAIESLEDFEVSFPAWRDWRKHWDPSGRFSGSAWLSRIGL